MNRTDVIQRIIDKKKAKTYLEIGVADGSNFFPIRALRKVAVDPHFAFPKKHRVKMMLKNSCNVFAKYYELTSDKYFASVRHFYHFDVVFIDGLHTYQQSLRDVFNSLNTLNKQGVIVMHDCNPPHEAAAYPANSYDHVRSSRVPGQTREWCGDVWKTICYLRSHRKDTRIFVLDCDQGLGIVTRGEADNRLNLTKENLDKMTYNDLASDRKNLLNLRDESYLSEFLDTI